MVAILIELFGGRKRMPSLLGQVSWVTKMSELLWRCWHWTGVVEESVFISVCVRGLSTCNAVDAVEHQVFIRWCTSDANAMQLRCSMVLRRK